MTYHFYVRCKLSYEYILIKCRTSFINGIHCTQYTVNIMLSVYLPKTKKFGCVGRGDLTCLFFSKVVKY